MKTKESATMLAEIVEIDIAEFLAMSPAPGHRDSEGRAQKSTHLHKFIPEHTAVEIAEYKDDSGELHRTRMTGNTRAQVWKCGLSDRVPSKVQARVYRMENEKEVRERMLFHDSPEAAWNAGDYLFRALDMTFAGTWKPASKALKSGRFILAVRLVDALTVHSRWTPEKADKVEKIMPDWQRELREVDAILDCPLAPSIAERKPFQSGFIAACLLISRYRPMDTLRRFISLVLDDAGTKNDEGMDGVQSLVEYLGKKKTSGVEGQQHMLIHVVSCFDQWENEKRVKTIKKINPLEWHQSQRDVERDRAKARKSPTAQ